MRSRTSRKHSIRDHEEDRRPTRGSSGGFTDLATLVAPLLSQKAKEVLDEEKAAKREKESAAEKEREQQRKSPRPSLKWEKLFGFPTHVVAGVDEVGRGCLAGPVVSAAAVLPIEWAAVPLAKLARKFPLLSEIRDSKLLSAKRREEIYEFLIAVLPAFEIAEATREEIDQLNIYHATHLSMCRALEALKVDPNAILIDGNRAPKGLESTRSVRTVVKTIVKGDQQSLSIACASILAKVHRDRALVKLSERYPNHEFAKHKGYSTSLHLNAIQKWGVTPEHRLSFGPVREYVIRNTAGGAAAFFEAHQHLKAVVKFSPDENSAAEAEAFVVSDLQSNLPCLDDEVIFETPVN